MIVHVMPMLERRALCAVRCALCVVRCAMCAVRYALCNVRYAMYAVQCVLSDVRGDVRCAVHADVLCACRCAPEASRERLPSEGGPRDQVLEPPPAFAIRAGRR